MTFRVCPGALNPSTCGLALLTLNEVLHCEPEQFEALLCLLLSLFNFRHNELLFFLWAVFNWCENLVGELIDKLVEELLLGDRAWSVFPFRC